MPQYLLTDQPWIPCERMDGTYVELGLRQALCQAHELRALSDPSPLVTGSLHRLLLAIVHRCFGPATLGDWAALYQAGRFDGAAVERYLDQWQARFDLFAGDRPFYQTAGLPYGAKPAAELVAERSNYGAALQVFEHRPLGMSGALATPVAARALVAAQAFKPGGTVSRAAGESPSAGAAPLNPVALVLVAGGTLFQTLMLNTLVYDPAHGQPIPSSGPDAPAWEQEEPVRVERRPAHGWLDLLTWQSRRLELRPSPDGTQVEEIILAGGWNLDTEACHDPMVAYTSHPKRGWLPLRLDQDRAVWRDAHVLLQATDAVKATERPKAVVQLTSPKLKAIVPPTSRHRLEVLGLCGDKARILFTRVESLPISPHLLADPDLGNLIEEAQHSAEAGGKALDYALRRAARFALPAGDREPLGQDISQVVEAGGGLRNYWARLRSPFLDFLAALADDDDTAIERYRPAIRTVALESFRHATAALGDTARGLKGRAIAEASLRRELFKEPS